MCPTMPLAEGVRKARMRVIWRRTCEICPVGLRALRAVHDRIRSSLRALECSLKVNDDVNIK